MSADPFAIALLDDHPAILHGLRIALHSGMFRVVGAFTRIDDFLAGLDDYERTHGRPVDVALVDYQLGPDAVDGMAMIQRMRRRHPGTKLIVMTAMEQDGIKSLVLSAGAHGFIGKSVPTEGLQNHILTVLRHRQVVDPPMRPTSDAAGKPSTADRGLHLLSAREMEVFRCLVNGMATGEIARKFKRAPSTISTQIRSLSDKLGVASINELLSQKSTWLSLLADVENEKSTGA